MDRPAAPRTLPVHIIEEHLMAEHRQEPPDVARLQDPDVRRAVRLVYNEAMNAVAKHQVVMEALLEALLEKHVTSIGEFKRLIAKVEQKAPGAAHVLEQVMSHAPQVPHPPPTNRPLH